LTSQLELNEQRKAREESQVEKEGEEKEPIDPPFRNLVIFYKFVDETQVSNLRKRVLLCLFYIF
jgi:hypothetical protein